MFFMAWGITETGWPWEVFLISCAFAVVPAILGVGWVRNAGMVLIVLSLSMAIWQYRAKQTAIAQQGHALNSMAHEERMT
jgi:hypothetical protein